jgi:hypothetical protein
MLNESKVRWKQGFKPHAGKVYHQPGVCVPMAVAPMHSPPAVHRAIKVGYGTGKRLLIKATGFSVYFV